MGAVLVLEDELLISLDLEMNLGELGFAEVYLATSVDQAYAVLAARQIELAIIDYNLGPETAEPVLHQLEARNIPFVLLTGYPDARFLGDGAKMWPMLSKPASKMALQKAVAAMQSRGAGAIERRGEEGLGRSTI